MIFLLQVCLCNGMCICIGWLCDIVSVGFHFVCLYAGIKLMLAGLGCGV